jgi:hypothetical protein
MWTLIFGYHENRTPSHYYAPTRGHDGGVQEELAAAINESPRALAGYPTHDRSLDMAALALAIGVVAQAGAFAAGDNRFERLRPPPTERLAVSVGLYDPAFCRIDANHSGTPLNKVARRR